MEPEETAGASKRKAVWQFLLALGVVLVGVALGSMLVLKDWKPRPADKPTALGHPVADGR